ncbi:winged helix-turn-helix transcriptional regulator [Deinococcus pimensis]|uniref:winged helix-turn-helix transcriptional regulator n=1 Tax=Deinococcus pimensis TaxID=309888 RepID=UPI000480FFA8|nr:winged helix-turn-helix transcriptional regulator [Deinococcus pimensis]
MRTFGFRSVPQPPRSIQHLPVVADQEALLDVLCVLRGGPIGLRPLRVALPQHDRETLLDVLLALEDVKLVKRVLQMARSDRWTYELTRQGRAACVRFADDISTRRVVRLR